MQQRIPTCFRNMGVKWGIVRVCSTENAEKATSSLFFSPRRPCFFASKRVTTLSRGSKALLDHGRSRFENPTRARLVKCT